ncbi:hypothetical protein KEM55_002603, partial [Ascosphaera atra]
LSTEGEQLIYGPTASPFSPVLPPSPAPSFASPPGEPPQKRRRFNNKPAPAVLIDTVLTPIQSESPPSPQKQEERLSPKTKKLPLKKGIARVVKKPKRKPIVVSVSESSSGDSSVPAADKKDPSYSPPESKRKLPSPSPFMLNSKDDDLPPQRTLRASTRAAGVASRKRALEHISGSDTQTKDKAKSRKTESKASSSQRQVVEAALPAERAQRARRAAPIIERAERMRQDWHSVMTWPEWRAARQARRAPEEARKDKGWADPRGKGNRK